MIPWPFFENDCLCFQVTDIDLSFPTAGSMPKWKTKTYDHWVPELPEVRFGPSIVWYKEAHCPASLVVQKRM